MRRRRTETQKIFKFNERRAFDIRIVVSMFVRRRRTLQVGLAAGNKWLMFCMWIFLDYFAFIWKIKMNISVALDAASTNQFIRNEMKWTLNRRWRAKYSPISVQWWILIEFSLVHRVIRRHNMAVCLNSCTYIPHWSRANGNTIAFLALCLRTFIQPISQLEANQIEYTLVYIVWLALVDAIAMGACWNRSQITSTTSAPNSRIAIWILLLCASEWQICANFHSLIASKHMRCENCVSFFVAMSAHGVRHSAYCVGWRMRAPIGEVRTGQITSF